MSPIRVLCDYHHHDLWESLELLFARLGWELYRPIGMDWFDQGYWNFERQWHGDAVARQYLEPWGSDEKVINATKIGDEYVWQPHGTTRRFDHSHGRWQNLVTLELARAMKFDVVIASVAHNHEGLHRFAREVGATFGLQLGNVRFSHIDMREDRWDLADFGLVSAIMPETPSKPHVIYHQEFSLEDFRHEPPVRDGDLRIASFVNCFPENRQAYAGFRTIAAQNPQWDWRVYGAYGSVAEDEYACGNIGRCADVGAAMRASDVAWHTKQWSDGFGHVIHNWFAVGRPVLGHEWYYRSQLAGPLWVEGVTSFDITDRSVDYVASLIRRLDEDADLHQRMSAAAAARFREVVNFDAEAEAIRAMFAQVLP